VLLQKIRSKSAAALTVSLVTLASITVPATSGAVATTVPTSLGSGLSKASHLAVDGSGDVFVADTGNNRVVEITPSGTQTVIGTGLLTPTAVAVDSAGNVFIADSGHSRVVKVTAAGVQTTIPGKFILPRAIAVDSAGTIYVAVTGEIAKLTTSYLQHGGTISYITGLVATGTPDGLSVDAAKNLYVSDQLNGQIIEVAPASDGTSVATGFAHPRDVAVDAQGDIFVVDNNAQVTKITPGGTRTVIESTLTAPFGVAVDTAGNVYIADNMASSITVVPAPAPVGPVAPSTPTITNLPSSATFPSSFTAAVSTNSDGTISVSSSTTAVCTVSGLSVSVIAAGTCTLTAQSTATSNYLAATGSAQSFTVARATPSSPTISNMPTSALMGASFVATVTTSGDGTASVASTTTATCTTNLLTVSFIAPGVCSLVAHVAQGTNYLAASGSPQSVTVTLVTPATPTITNAPTNAVKGGSLLISVSTSGPGIRSVTSSTKTVCVTSGLNVSFVTFGTCTLTPQVAASGKYAAATGTPKSFSVYKAASSAPKITNIPTSATAGGHFVATVSTTGTGTKSVTSSTPSVCTVSTLTVTYLAAGTCTLTAAVAAGASLSFAPATGSAQSFTVKP